MPLPQNIYFFKPALRKSQLSLFDWKQAPKREEKRSVQATQRRLASGAIVAVRQHERKMQVSSQQDSLLQHNQVQVRGKDGYNVRHGESVYYKTPDMPRKQKGTIVSGEFRQGYEIKPIRAGYQFNPPHRHNISRDHIWTQQEHAAEKAHSGMRNGRLIKPEEMRRRAALGTARLGIPERDVLRHPLIAPTIKKFLRKTASTNNINPNYTDSDGFLYHPEDTEANELYSAYIDKALQNLRTTTSKYSDQEIGRFKAYLEGKSDGKDSKILLSFHRTGQTAVMRYLIDRDNRLKTQRQYDTSAEDDQESGMRQVAARSAVMPEVETRETGRAALEAAIDRAIGNESPVDAAIIKMQFGLGQYERARKPSDVAAALNRLNIPHESMDGWNADRVKQRSQSVLMKMAKNKQIQQLREFLKSRVEPQEAEDWLCKAYIREYTRNDGTVVAAHFDKRTKKHPDLIGHENRHGDQIHTDSRLSHGAALLQEMKERGWKTREEPVVRKKGEAKSKDDLPEPSVVPGKNPDNANLMRSQKQIHEMHEAVKKAENPVAALLAMNTTRSNTYHAAVDDEKKRLLEHFGYEVDEDKKHTKYQKDGHTIIAIQDGDQHRIVFAGHDTEHKGSKPVGRLAGKKEVEAVDTGQKEAKFILGRENRAYTAKLNEVKSNYALVNVHDLTTSHTISGHVNKAYPQEIQPRERERISSQIQMSNIMQDIKPELFGHSATAADGAPIVGKDGAVESGNGRTIALAGAYKRGLANKYKEWLKQEAEHFGLDPQEVEKMEAPMLVRVRADDDKNTDRAEFARESNQSSNLGSSPAEQAWTDADRIDDALLRKYTVDEDGEVYNEGNMGFINGFLDKLGKNEAASLRDSDGDPNKKCIERVQNAVFAKVYGSSLLTEYQAESAKPKIRNVLRALNACVADFVHTRQHDDLDVIPDMMEAIEYYLAHRNESKSDMEYKLKHYGSLKFSEEDTAFKTDHAINMTLAIVERAGSRSRLENVFRAISNEIKNEVALRENPEVDMFAGPYQPKNKEQVVGQALGKLRAAEEETNKSFSNSGLYLLRKAHVRATSYVNKHGKVINRRSYHDKRTRKTDRPGSATSIVSEVSGGTRRPDHPEQLAFDFVFRDGTSDKHKADSVSLGRRTAGLCMRRGNYTVLANAVAEEVTRRGTVSFIGKQVSQPSDLALMAQVFRNPRYETMRYFFVKGNTIVGQTGVSSRLPSAATLFPAGVGGSPVRWIREQMQACGADGYYMMHNHPSGSVEASGPDMASTERLANELPGFKGHLIINHNKYNWIGKNIKQDIREANFSNTEDPHKKQPVPHEILGRSIADKEDLINIGQELKVADGYMLVVANGAGQKGVTGIAEVPITIGKKRLAAVIRKFSLQTAAGNTFLVYPQQVPEAHEGWVTEAMEQGFVLDVVAGDYSYFKDKGITKYRPDVYFGKPMTGVVVDKYSDEIQKSAGGKDDRGREIQTQGSNAATGIGGSGRDGQERQGEGGKSQEEACKPERRQAAGERTGSNSSSTDAIAECNQATSTASGFVAHPVSLIKSKARLTLTETYDHNGHLIHRWINTTNGTTENKFVLNSRGKTEFGEITTEVGAIIQRQAGKIRLRQGNPAEGLIHISRKERLKQLQSVGYNSGEEAAEDVAENYDSIYQGKSGALLLVLHKTPRMVIYTKLIKHASGEFYDIKTVAPSRVDAFKNKTPLWERAQSNQIQENPSLRGLLSQSGGTSDKNITTQKNDVNKSSNSPSAVYNSTAASPPREANEPHGTAKGAIYNLLQSLREGKMSKSSDAAWEIRIPFTNTKPIRHNDLLKAYKLDGKMDFNGIPISIENGRSRIRAWHDPHNNTSGMTLMKHPYGYIRGIKGTDGDELDVYVGPDRQAKNVYIVNQMKAPGFTKFDEQKVMLGFADQEAARSAYLKHYDNPRFLGSITVMPLEEFREKVMSGRFDGKMVKSDTSHSKRKAMKEAAIAAGANCDEVIPEEFYEGMEEETEHYDITGGDLVTTAKIVLAHLKENPKYYSRMKAAGL